VTNIAFKYLGKEVYRASFLVLLALLGLFTFFSVVDQLEAVGRPGFGIRELAWLEFLTMPTRIYDLLPIALLVGAILALAGLAARQEITILRVSGLSAGHILKALWLACLPLVALAILVSEILAPYAEFKYSEARIGIHGEAGRGTVLRSGYWFKEELDGRGFRVVNIQRLAAGGELAGVSLYEFDTQHRLQRFAVAAQGRLQQGALHLSQATIRDLSGIYDIDVKSLERQPIGVKVHQQDLIYPSNLNADRLLARVVTPERMSLFNLVDYIGYLTDNRLVADRQIVAMWRKLIYPFTLLVMVAIAAPVAFMQTRRGGVGGKVFVGVLLGVAFYMLNQLALNLGLLIQAPAWLTALAPNLLVLMLAVAVLVALEWRTRLSLWIGALSHALAR
jgi:lipopolysaccharide export system permease protein